MKFIVHKHGVQVVDNSGMADAGLPVSRNHIISRGTTQWTTFLVMAKAIGTVDGDGEPVADGEFLSEAE